MKTKVCTCCGHVGKPVSQGLDSFIIDGVAWFFVIGFVLTTYAMPLLLIPIAWTIYHLIVYRTITCPKCKNLDMVSMQSHKGKESLLKWSKGEAVEA